MSLEMHFSDPSLGIGAAWESGQTTWAGSQVAEELGLTVSINHSTSWSSPGYIIKSLYVLVKIASLLCFHASFYTSVKMCLSNDTCTAYS